MQRKTIKQLIIKILAPFKRVGLKNRDYTIISNNCYGGIVSRDFGLPYNSPTCGTYFFAKEYLKFISNLKAHIDGELVELKVEDSAYKEQLMPKHGTNIVLGKVLDAEIVFVHYKTFEEAKQKWDRRKKRVNYDNLIVKFNDQNLFSEEDYYTFANLPYENKIFFTANKSFKGKEYVTYFSCFEGQGYAVDDIKTSKKYFNIKKYLNSIITKERVHPD